MVPHPASLNFIVGVQCLDQLNTKIVPIHLLFQQTGYEAVSKKFRIRGFVITPTDEKSFSKKSGGFGNYL
jgi:hypothetical protein